MGGLYPCDGLVFAACAGVGDLSAGAAGIDAMAVGGGGIFARLLVSAGVPPSRVPADLSKHPCAF